MFDLLAMDTDLPHLFRQRVIIGENGTTVSVAPKRFGWEKRGTADGRECARLFAVVDGAEALSAVFNDRDAVLFGNRVNSGKNDVMGDVGTFVTLLDNIFQIFMDSRRSPRS